jgi:hypothetical protein
MTYDSKQLPRRGLLLLLSIPTLLRTTRSKAPISKCKQPTVFILPSRKAPASEHGKCYPATTMLASFARQVSTGFSSIVNMATLMMELCMKL